MKLIKIIGFCSFVCLVNFHAFSGDELLKIETLIKNNKYQQAAFELENYTKINPTNYSAYFNLGNCYFFQKKYGHAIWAFEKSLKFNPRDKDAIYNLEVSYRKLQKITSWESSISWIERGFYSMGSNFWSYIAILLSIVLSVIVYLFVVTNKSEWKRVQLLSGLFIFSLTVFSILLSYFSKQFFTSNEFAIVISKSIPVYEDQNSANKMNFLLMEGDRIKIISENSNRYFIELLNKEVCSIEKTGVKKI